MKRGFLSRRRIVPATSLALAFGLTILWRARLPTFRPDPELQALLVEKARLTPFTKETRERLHAELASFEARSRERKVSVGPAWRIEEVAPDSRGIPRVRYLADSTVRWPEIVSLMQQLGDAAESLDIRSQGNLTRREIASAVVVARHPSRPKTRARPVRTRSGPSPDPVLIRRRSPVA